MGYIFSGKLPDIRSGKLPYQTTSFSELVQSIPPDILLFNPGLWIRIHFLPVPDPAVFLNADPEPLNKICKKNYIIKC